MLFRFSHATSCLPLTVTWGMSLVSHVVALLLVWVAIHAIHYARKPSKTHSLLPSTSNSRLARHGFWKKSTTQVILKAFHLRLQTTAWNLHHDILATELKKERRLFLSQTLRVFYDLGSVFGIFGMLVGLGLLLWTCGLSVLSLAGKVLENSSNMPSSDSSGLTRRDLGTVGEAVPLTEDTLSVKPIIPGVTVPVAHVPLILVAVFLVQVVHEFGHAITAALYDFPCVCLK